MVFFGFLQNIFLWHHVVLRSLDFMISQFFLYLYDNTSLVFYYKLQINSKLFF